MLKAFVWAFVSTKLTFLYMSLNFIDGNVLYLLAIFMNAPESLSLQEILTKLTCFEEFLASTIIRASHLISAIITDDLAAL